MNMHAALKHYHLMVSLPPDLHDTVPPVMPPPPPTPTPYWAGYLLSGSAGYIVGTVKLAEDVHHDSMGYTMLRGTDIGPLIPHVGAPNILLPLVLAMSGSKSHFACSTVVSRDGPVACALAFIVNPNLNCAGPSTSPFPRPNGIVIAFYGTTFEGMTWGDLFAGALSMAFDCLVEGLINKFFGCKRVTGWFDRVGSRLFSRLAVRMFGRGHIPSMLKWFGSGQGSLWGGNLAVWISRATGSGVARTGNLISNGILRSTLPYAAGVLFGSPVGAAVPWSPAGYWLGRGHDAGYDSTRNAVNNYLSSPNVDDMPTATGSGAAAGAPSSQDAGVGSPDGG